MPAYPGASAPFESTAQERPRNVCGSLRAVPWVCVRFRAVACDSTDPATRRRARRRACARVESDMPTTVDGSPSTRSMNAPPRLSIVNAPATCSGSPEATYAAISASVTSDAKVTDACATACASTRLRSRTDPDDAVPGVQHARPAAHRPPARGRDLGGVRLAEDLAVDLEHRVAADHDPVETGLIRGDAGRDIRSLAAREQQDVLVRREAPTFGRLDVGDDRVLVHLGSHGERFDPRLAQQHEPGGGRRGEADPHGSTVAARPAGCGMLRAWMLRQAQRQPGTNSTSTSRASPTAASSSGGTARSTTRRAAAAA